MRTTHMMLETSSRRRLTWMVGLAGFVLLVVGHAPWSFAQKSGPKTFSSPGEACQALFQAVQNDDEQGLEAILGAGKEVTSSGDEAQDKLERERFSQKYQEMHRLVLEPDGTTVLYIGAENWPFPIPLVSKHGRWSFDSKTGMQEILFRRVGENEATAIQVCHALALAEKQHETKATSNDPISQYAQSLVSADSANADNTARATLAQEPFHGYYFRILTEQPGNTVAGIDSHVSGGKKKGALAFVAYPAEYQSSGVMTFIVTKDGVVYERDLGPNTARLTRNMKERRPASG
jgi:Protein of unknown function (DUF2950)